MAMPQIQDKPEDNIFDAVRWSYETVAAMAKHVKICEDKIADYAASFPEMSPENVFDAEHHYESEDPEKLAAYVLILDSINFGSGYEPMLVEQGWTLIDESLYFTLSTRLKQYFDYVGIMTATQLSQMTTEDCCELLGLNVKMKDHKEFAGQCALSMRELGHVIMEEYEGSFLKFVERANGSVEKLVRQMVSMHHFSDIHDYQGLMVPFYKRAQITAADLQLAFARRGITLFEDMEQLTMFPDNAVPHVLRVDGILEYSDDLAARIDRGDIIESGSEEEIELRACAGQVVELLAKHLDMRSMDVDHILWHRSVEGERYLKSQPHRTLSRFY